MNIKTNLLSILSYTFTEYIKENKLESKLSPYLTQRYEKMDLIMKKSTGKSIFFIDILNPTKKQNRNIMDNNLLFNAIIKAQENNIRYFGICNFVSICFVDTQRFANTKFVCIDLFTTQDIKKISKKDFIPDNHVQEKCYNIVKHYVDFLLESVENK